MATAEQLAFIMTVLKNSDIKFDWPAIAVEEGISLPGNAQRKFRQIVDQAGYKFSAGKIIPGEGVTGDVKTEETAKTPGGKAKGTKRKAAVKEDATDEAPAAKKGKGKGKAKGLQPVVEIEKKVVKAEKGEADA